uniref:Uncharacterized protein ycf35 n=1 Tax=Schimmelmannia schousboei TaxID=173468 RepID=A0A1C9C8V6_9FLOR|nr:hypothetical protein Schim_129 [Schimmelmannia schousboei]AOM64810.1 hypothetical protein Schim_129 [Schimmelmannia schousboei]
MSHFSKIKTSISNLETLKKTLKDFKIDYKINKCFIQDGNKNLKRVDLIVHENNNDLFGFSWDGQEYSLVADLQFWNQKISVERFIEKLIQQYALNAIVEESINEGFKQIDKEVMKDGSIKLVIQRWN